MLTPSMMDTIRRQLSGRRPQASTFWGEDLPGNGVDDFPKFPQAQWGENPFQYRLQALHNPQKPYGNVKKQAKHSRRERLSARGKLGLLSR